MLKDLCFEVIQKCPNNCKFCSSNSSFDENKIIKIEDFKKTLDYFINQGGIEELSISGGEPFLHPDLFEMIKYSKDNGIRTVLFTSGIKENNPINEKEIEFIKQKCEQDLLEVEKNEPWNDRLKEKIKKYYERLLKRPKFSGITKEECKKLKDLGLDKIVFDWQTIEEKVDNELMGRKGLITCLIDSLIKASQMGLNVDVHFIPMKPNYRSFSDIIECLEMTNVRSISILNFVPQGRGKENKQELMLNSDEVKEFSEILKREKNRFSGNIRIGIPLNGQISHLCTAGTEKLDIKYDGTILPCPAFKELDLETMDKYGIKLYSIYDDLENIGFALQEGKREKPLCKQIYGFDSDLTK